MKTPPFNREPDIGKECEQNTLTFWGEFWFVCRTLAICMSLSLAFILFLIFVAGGWNA